jgi:hypothetical protein
MQQEACVRQAEAEPLLAGRVDERAGRGHPARAFEGGGEELSEFWNSYREPKIRISQRVGRSFG